MTGRLNDQRLWLISGALVAALIFLVSWLLFISPTLSAASDLDDQTIASRQQNDALVAKIKTLEAKRAQLPRYTSSLRAALAAIPYDSGLPAFTRRLTAQGKATGVDVSSVVVGGVVPIEPSAVSSAGSASTSESAATTPSGGLFSIQLTVQSDGSLTNQIAFLTAVRTLGPRRTLITAMEISPGTGAKVASVDGAASFTTQLTVFSAPQSPVQIRQLNKLVSGDLGN